MGDRHDPWKYSLDEILKCARLNVVNMLDRPTVTWAFLALSLAGLCGCFSQKNFLWQFHAGGHDCRRMPVVSLLSWNTDSWCLNHGKYRRSQPHWRSCVWLSTPAPDELRLPGKALSKERAYQEAPWHSAEGLHWPAMPKYLTHRILWTRIKCLFWVILLGSEWLPRSS